MKYKVLLGGREMEIIKVSESEDEVVIEVKKPMSNHRHYITTPPTPRPEGCDPLPRWPPPEMI